MDRSYPCCPHVQVPKQLLLRRTLRKCTMNHAAQKKTCSMADCIRNFNDYSATACWSPICPPNHLFSCPPLLPSHMSPSIPLFQASLLILTSIRSEASYIALTSEAEIPCSTSILASFVLRRSRLSAGPSPNRHVGSKKRLSCSLTSASFVGAAIVRALISS